MLFPVYFCWNTVCNGIYVHPVSLHCMDLPSVISFIIKFTAQSSWVVLVGLVASSLLDVFFIFWFVNLIQLCKSWWTEGRVSGGCKGKKSENLSSAFAWLYISYFTNYERKIHQTPVCIFNINVEVQILSPFLLGYFNVW